MKSSSDIIAETKQILATQWTRRDGRVVPDAEDLKLGNDAVQLEGTVLYADMADSTGLVQGFRDWFAAKVYKAYLVAACHAIRNNDGSITAFDGDRVMAVFIGDLKNTSAVKTALQINYIIREVNSALKAAYPSAAFQLRQKVGIDTSNLLVTRTGIRNSNDLAWVGRAANYAAKLCGLCDATYSTAITAEVYKAMHESAKLGGEQKVDMWTPIMWQERGVTVYRSNWTWRF